jgi:hypothetical protein
VLESFGIRQEPLRQAFIASMGDPWDPKPTHTRVVDATEGVALPEPPEPLEPPPPSEAGPADALDRAPNPLGHDPRRRSSRAYRPPPTTTAPPLSPVRRMIR